MKTLFVMFVVLCFYAFCNASNVEQLKQQLRQVHSNMKLTAVVTTRSTYTSFVENALARRGLLKSLIQQDPEAANEFVLSLEQRLAEFGVRASDDDLFEQYAQLSNAAFSVVITMLEQDHAHTTPMQSVIERVVEVFANETTTKLRAYATQAVQHVQSNAHTNIVGFIIDDMLLMQEVVTARNTRQMASSWTTGSKRLLYIRVDFADQPGEVVSIAAATSTLNTLKTYWANASFNQLALTGWTITPVLRVPQSTSFYGSGSNYLQLLNDAKATAATVGFSVSNYNLFVVIHPRISGGWSGRGYVGTAGAWLNANNGFYAIAHELGHNLGLWHANTLVNGANEEYGDFYDPMGRCQSNLCHYNLRNKLQLGWIPSSSIIMVTSPGTYNITAMDHPHSRDKALGLAFSEESGDASKYYLVSYRSLAVPSNSLYQLNNGALDVHIAYSSYDSVRSSHYVDTTPASSTRDPISLNATWTLPTTSSKYSISLVQTECVSKAPCVAIIQVSINDSSNYSGGATCAFPYVPCNAQCYVPAHQSCINGQVRSIRPQ